MQKTFCDGLRLNWCKIYQPNWQWDWLENDETKTMIKKQTKKRITTRTTKRNKQQRKNKFTARICILLALPLQALCRYALKQSESYPCSFCRRLQIHLYKCSRWNYKGSTFLLSYFKTLSVGPVGVSNSRCALRSPKPPVRGCEILWCCYM